MSNFYTLPHKACDWDASIPLKFPLIVMPKVDGVRGLKVGDRFTGRTLKPFANRWVTHWFSNPIFDGFDGELICGEMADQDLCRKTTSAVNSIAGYPQVKLCVFDYLTEHTLYLPYEKRLSLLTSRISELYETNPQVSGRVLAMPWQEVMDEFALAEIVQSHLTAGYEGTIVRSAGGYHKAGRATAREGAFLRIKEFKDAEAVIEDFEPEMENLNFATVDNLGLTVRSSHKENKLPKNRIGAFICRRLPEGDIIKVGSSSLPHEWREYYFNNFDEIRGAILTYKYFPKGIKDKPRFPTLRVDKSNVPNSFKVLKTSVDLDL